MPITPSLSIKFPLDGNNIVNGVEILSPLKITGSASGLVSKDAYTVEVVIKNAGGQIVDTFAVTGLHPGSAGNLAWSVSGSLLSFPDGAYSVNALLFDTTKSSTTPIVATAYATNLTIDTTASISINPVDGDWGINKAQAQHAVAITGSTIGVEAGQTATLKFVNSAGQTLSTLKTLVGSNGSWSVSLSASLVAGLANGSYQVQASVADIAGNKASTTHSLVVEKTPPSLTLGLVAGDDILTASEAQSPLTINGTATGANGQSVSVILNGHTYTGAVANGLWSVSVPVTDLALLQNGSSYTVTANVADAYGNPALQASQTLAVHDVAPKLTMGLVAGDDILNGSEAQTTQTIGGTTTGANGLVVTVTLNNHSYTGIVANGLWSVSVPVTDLAMLQNGSSYPVTASITDAYGNMAQVNQSLAVELTTHAPVVSLLNDTGISSTDKVTNDSTLVVTGIENGATLSYSLDGSTWSATAPTNASYGANGPKAVLVRSTDAAGNSAQTLFAFTLETTPDVAGNLAVTPTATTFTATDEAGVGFAVSGLDPDATATVTFTDSANNSVVVPNLVDGSDAANLSSLANGPVAMTITASDSAGNFATGTGASLTLDTSTPAPVVSLLDDTGISSTDKVTSDGALVVTGTANGATISYSLDDGTSWTTTSPTTASYSANGVEAVLVKSTDVAGTSATTSFTFTLETTPDVAGNLAVTPTSTTVSAANDTAVGFTVSGLDPDATATVTFTDSAKNTVVDSNLGNGAAVVDLSSLTPGLIATTVTASDTAGNFAAGTGGWISLGSGVDSLDDFEALVLNNTATAFVPLGIDANGLLTNATTNSTPIAMSQQAVFTLVTEKFIVENAFQISPTNAAAFLHFTDAQMQTAINLIP